MQLRFRLGSIPVRVNGAFLFLLLVLGAQLQRPDLIAVAVWAVIVFVSVLIHELGHALTGRLFGLVPAIDLNGMGGLTSWQNPETAMSHGRLIAISLAGPFAGFLVAGGLLLARRLGLHPQHTLAVFAFKHALFVNLGWGIFNLAPMLPLDGGNVLRSVLNIGTKGRGEKPARVVSIVVGGLLLMYAVLSGQWLLGALAAFFTWANLQAYRQVDTLKANATLAQAVEKAYVALEKHDGAEAIALIRPALTAQASADLRAIALRVYCYALLIEGEWEELLPTLQKNGALIGNEEMARYAMTARELGRVPEAERIAALMAELSPPQPRPANDFG